MLLLLGRRIYVQPNSVLHHVDKLLIIYMTVAVSVDALKQLLDLFIIEGEVVAGEAHAELLLADRAAVVLVEVGEG